MKKIFFLVGVILILSTFYIFYPRTIDLDTQGLKYRLGAGSVGNEQIINVYIKGKMYRGLTGKKHLRGSLNLKMMEFQFQKDIDN